MHQVLQEGLGGIRDILLDNNQFTFIDIYSKFDRQNKKLEANNQFLYAFPKFALESIGMIFIAVIGGILIIYYDDSRSVIPVLGTFALGAQRLLPALQQIYGSWALLKACHADLIAILTFVSQPLHFTETKEILPFKSTLRLYIPSFKYLKNSPNVLNDIDICISPGERVGIVGSTGSGKSTLVDLIMGLLQPPNGFLSVDGVILNGINSSIETTKWRNGISHVPQSIFLTDNTISENVAFGIPKEQIDMKRVTECASRAQLSKFIESLSLGYSTFVGERGIRLSGGQKQRIGVARALYKNAQLLVLDEATSALDTLTEQNIMSQIDNIDSNCTILIIAHRLSTLKTCDRIIELKSGSIHFDGSSSDFSKMKTS